MNCSVFYLARDEIGKEIVTRYSSDLRTNGIFFTDANGREILKRQRNFRPSWPYKVINNWSLFTIQKLETDNRNPERAETTGIHNTKHNEMRSMKFNLISLVYLSYWFCINSLITLCPILIVAPHMRNLVPPEISKILSSHYSRHERLN